MKFVVGKVPHFSIGGGTPYRNHALNVVTPAGNYHRLNVSLTYLTEWRTCLSFCVAKVSRDRTLSTKFSFDLGEVSIKQEPHLRLGRRS